MIERLFSSSLFKTSFMYIFVSILNSAIPFLLLPILTRYLTPEDYGIVTMFSLLVSVLGAFSGLSVHGAVNRVYFEENIDFREYVANTLLILILSTFVIFIVLVPVIPIISKLTSVPEKWIFIAILVSFFNFIIFIHMSIYQARSIATKYAFLQISQTLINVGLSILFVVVLELMWTGRALGIVVSSVFVGTISTLIIIKKWAKFRININYIKHALSFGLPLIPHSIGGLLIAMSDRLIINNVLDVSAVGLYMVALQVGMIIEILARSFNQAYTPWLFNNLRKNDDFLNLKIVKFTYIMFALYLILGILFGLFAPILFEIFIGKQFYSASQLVIWISLGAAFNGMYYMVGIYIMYLYKNFYLPIVTFIDGIINLLLTYILVRSFGISGAAYSFLCINILNFLVIFIIVIRISKLPWKIWKEEFKCL